MGSAESAC